MKHLVTIVMIAGAVLAGSLLTSCVTPAPEIYYIEERPAPTPRPRHVETPESFRPIERPATYSN